MSNTDLDFNAPAGDLGPGSWQDIESAYQPEDAGSEGEVTKGGINDANPESGGIGLVLTLLTNPDGSHSFTGVRNIDAVLIGSKWGTLNLTFSFPAAGSNYNGRGYDSNGVSNYQMVLGAEQQAAARAAFAQLSALTGLTFTEITETGTVHANIRISQTADNDAPSAYGGFPSDTNGVAGDIWFGRTSQPYYDLPAKGDWGFATIMHEIGHTMGLKHGHQDYTNSDLSFYFGTTPRFGTQSLTPDRDGQDWSLMTYTPAPFTNSNFAGEKINQPQTYMQYDLAALQYLYGANYNTNSGDTVYTFSQTTGEMFVNGVGQGAPAGNKILLTIWDGGGNDTIDASNYAGGVTVDLRPGEFSTLDQAQLANHLAYQNLTSLSPGNIAMSLLYNNDPRSLIENAKGGAGNDIFIGNTANNVLDGGAGSDTVIFTNTTGVNVTLNDTNSDVIVSHDGETDTLRSIENIGGTSGNDTITGNSQDNILTGGSGGADTLSGGAGDDRLLGGGFTTTTTVAAPSQPDITKPQSVNNGSIATAVATAGAYDVDANPNITSATTIPHATINATAAGGALEYYRIDVTVPGTQAIFDIDGPGTLDDSFIELVNSSGTVLASNDTGTGDTTYPGHDDAYLTFTFATAGTYYIRIGLWNGAATAQPLNAGQTYQLNISLQNAAVITTTVTANNTSSLVADGGDGNDILQGTLANDVLNGGNGTDTASFFNAFSGGSTTGVTVDLNVQGVAQNTVAAGTDTLTGIENLIGSSLNDTLIGNGGDNVIEGGLGNDSLSGGAGSDTASYAGAAAGVAVSLALQGAGQNTVNAGTDTLSGFENLLGSAFGDALTGDANANTLSGGAGDDVLNPGSNAAGAVDLLDGGAGSDIASFAGQTAAVVATLNGATDAIATVGGVAVATLRNIEGLTGGSGADILTGDGNANVIDGGLGDDILVGGAGIDTVSFASRGSAGISVNLATLTAQNTGAGNDTISGFENVRATAGNDVVTGDANDNIFFDTGGNDTYNGAAGFDTVDYSAATSAVTVNLNTLTAQNTGTFGGTDTITNMENVTGSATFANTLTGNALANKLVGGSALDTIVGNGGADTIIGGAGDDILLGGTSAALDDGSADVLEGGAGSDYLSGGQGNDILRGGDGDDNLIGGVGNTARQFFTGVDGGDDTYDGGDGTDIAFLIYDGRLGIGASNVGISFDIGNLAGNSAITFNGVNVGSMISIERVTFRGTQVNDVVKGGATLDSLFGAAGDDTLDGWYGNDTLEGGAGNDTLIGGDGLDTATYASATAGVNVDLRLQGVAQNTGGAGIDTLTGIEYLTGSGFGDTLRGDDGFNLLIDSTVSGPAGQTDSLFGYGGNDTISVTRAAAAVATNVNMDGGDGDDLIQLIAGTVTFNLAANGTSADADGLSSGVSYAAPGRAGTRTLDTVTVSGGAGNDRVVLTGVATATIDLGTGNDVLSISTLGGVGVNAHDITTGAGQDVIQFAGVGAAATTTARANVVRDFTVGNSGDRFELRSATGGTFAATSWVNTTNFLGLTSTTQDMFDSGHMRLLQSGTDMLLQVDRDGTGVASGFVTVAILAGTYTGGFTSFNFDGMIGSLNLQGQGALNETLTGATKADNLAGNDGNDVLIGLAGNDTLDGGNGDDVLLGGLGDDILIGGSGSDTASYSDAAAGVTVNLGLAGPQATGAGNDSLSGIENLTGSAFNDVLTGDAGGNQIAGGAGNDLIDGGAGADTLIGGTGDDLYVVDDAGDQVVEAAGEGMDSVTSSVSYTLAANVENLTLSGTAANGTGNGLDNFITGNGSDNVLSGGAGNDTLTGLTGNDMLDGGTGADRMVGGTGDDTYVVDDAGDQVVEDGGEGTDTVRASIGYALGANVENLVLTGTAADGTGNELANVITGNDGANVLTGLAGDDTLIGNGGDDTLDGGTGADAMAGGTGNDLYIVDDAGDAVTEAAGEGTDIVRSSISYTLGANLENLVLTGTAANGTGNALANVITGNDSANVLTGGAGDDTLIGNGGDDTLDGGTGADAMAGGTGNDTYVVDDAGDAVTEAAGEGTDTVRSLISYTLGANLENLVLTDTAANGTGNELANVITGNDSANVLTGGAGDDTLIGNGGDDTLDGGTGADAMAGGTGNDTYVVDDAGDAVTEAASEGTDTVRSSISYTLGANLENLVLTGAAANGTGNELANVLTGNEGANVLTGLAGNDTLIGNGGDDTLDGGTGADAMAGGTGNDLYIVDDAGDAVTEAAGEGADTVRASISYALTANVENLVLTGLAANGTGNELANVITGNDAANVLTGLAGDDTLIGNGGDDTLDGGTGADAMTGGTGNDLYFVDNVGDQVTELAGQGTDTVSSSISYTLGANVENLILTGTAADGTGNELANTVTGNDAANHLYGLAGNDILIGNGGNDVLDGGTGADAMAGGTGNDLYFVDNAGDQVTELAGQGIDTVSSSISYTLGANVENLTLTGSALDGTGNALDNILTGDAMSNHLSGGAGNDRLIGGGGLDYLSGGAGNDVFVAEITDGKVASKNGPISVDVILDFQDGDKIDLHGIDANANLAGFQSFTWVGEASGKNAGELSFNHYGSMDAAEKALGMELDGFDGKSPFDGPVTVVLGNVDGGAPDFALVLVNTSTIHSTDFFL
jgi:Ca2+-binding RTX toxin-like protein